jgi:hypothetical protein
VLRAVVDLYNGAVASLVPRSTGRCRPLARRRHAHRQAERRFFLLKCQLIDGLQTPIVRALRVVHVIMTCITLRLRLDFQSIRELRD